LTWEREKGRESDCDCRWREWVAAGTGLSLWPSLGRWWMDCGMGCGMGMGMGLGCGRCSGLLSLSSVGEATVLSVLCDQRLRLAIPSLKTPKASPAPAAALLRRLVPGGVDAVWGLDGSRIGSLKEASRWRVRVDEDESELLREGRRREGPAMSAAGLEVKRLMATLGGLWMG
jgi:hypothetical protein